MCLKMGNWLRPKSDNSDKTTRSLLHSIKAIMKSFALAAMLAISTQAAAPPHFEDLLNILPAGFTNSTGKSIFSDLFVLKQI